MRALTIRQPWAWADTVQPWLDSLSRMWADPDVVRGLELTPAQPEHWWISYSPLWGILDQPEAL